MKNYLFSMLAVVFVLAVGMASGRAEELNSKRKTIVQIAAGNPEFSMLAAAVKAAGLTKTLRGRGPFTVFAPTNAAFEKLPKRTLEDLFKPENKKKLAEVLTCHVMRGKVLAADVAELENAKTLQGLQAKIAVSKRGVKIDRAKIIESDIIAKNGVIHVVDAVILPQD